MNYTKTINNIFCVTINLQVEFPVCNVRQGIFCNIQNLAWLIKIIPGKN